MKYLAAENEPCSTGSRKGCRKLAKAPCIAGELHQARPISDMQCCNVAAAGILR